MYNKPEFDNDWVKLRKDLIKFSRNNRSFHHLSQDLADESITRTAKVYGETPHNFPAFENIRKYAHGVIKNLLVDLSRKKEQPSVHLPMHDDVRPTRQSRGTVIHKPSDRIDTRIDVQRALQKVPKEFQSVLRLRAQGYEYEEISQDLKLPIGTVKSRINRGLKALKKLLGE